MFGNLAYYFSMFGNLACYSYRRWNLVLELRKNYFHCNSLLLKMFHHVQPTCMFVQKYVIGLVLIITPHIFLNQINACAIKEIEKLAEVYIGSGTETTYFYCCNKTEFVMSLMLYSSGNQISLVTVKAYQSVLLSSV